MIDNNAIASNNLSNNNVASGNFSQNTLISFDGLFKGLENTVGLFIPTLRNALVERYRAETFYRIGLKAEEIIGLLGIETKPIPPKAALPLFEKASLEHDENMYDLWAKLLVSAANDYNPIQIQYAELLSKIGSNEARLLLKMYNVQSKSLAFRAFGGNMDKFANDFVFFNSERFIYKNIEIKALQTLNNIRKFVNIPSIVFVKLKHCFKKLTTKAEKDFRGYAKEIQDISKEFDSKENQLSLRVLIELGLVKNCASIYPTITMLGYELINELEKYSTGNT